MAWRASFERPARGGFTMMQPTGFFHLERKRSTVELWMERVQDCFWGSCCQVLLAQSTASFAYSTAYTWCPLEASSIAVTQIPEYRSRIGSWPASDEALSMISFQS